MTKLLPLSTWAMHNKCSLAELPIEDFRTAHESLDDKVYEVLGVERAVAAFKSAGSTSPARVAEQVAAWKERLS